MKYNCSTIAQLIAQLELDNAKVPEKSLQVVPLAKATTKKNIIK